jgi:AcrR family transcriptional regulator
MPSPKPPTQARSRKTLERIVGAGLALLEQGGPDAVTVQAVVARAGSSVGSFYARFRSKEDLLEHLREHLRSSAEAEWSETLEGSSWEESLPEIAAKAVDLLLDLRPRCDARVRAADRLVSGAAAGDDARPGLAGLEELAARLLQRRDEITHADPDLAVRVALTAVLGIGEHFQFREQSGAAVDFDRLRAECLQLVLSYLTEGAGGDGSSVDFFDVWADS